jgi:hypothetical protein
MAIAITAPNFIILVTVNTFSGFSQFRRAPRQMAVEFANN